MSLPEILNCPGTLAIGFETYSRTCLKRVFSGHKVSHILPYESPSSNSKLEKLFNENKSTISISGVQDKYSVVLDKNKLRLANEGEKGTYILKPIPTVEKNAAQMPANEHLTMQIASQVYGIETAENALIFFSNGEPAYITKRFDVREDGSKWAQDDFASIAGKTPQTHGENYKYDGNYLELFQLMQQYLPAYKTEAPKLFKLLLFNYLFSNGDAHLKNFSVIETPMGDYKLSPAYDLLNSRIHVSDKDFALNEGLLPPKLAKGKIRNQFQVLAKQVGINEKLQQSILEFMLSKSDKVETLINASFLSERMKRNYLQAYQGRVNKILR
jgi:serine/threonine-protein kinase HipA